LGRTGSVGVQGLVQDDLVPFGHDFDGAGLAVPAEEEIVLA
jgi:hypothetical protein